MAFDNWLDSKKGIWPIKTPSAGILLVIWLEHSLHVLEIWFAALLPPSSSYFKIQDDLQFLYQSANVQEYWQLKEYV